MNCLLLQTREFPRGARGTPLIQRCLCLLLLLLLLLLLAAARCCCCCGGGGILLAAISFSLAAAVAARVGRLELTMFLAKSQLARMPSLFKRQCRDFQQLGGMQQAAAADAVAGTATAMQVLQELGFDASTCAMVCQQVRCMQPHALILPMLIMSPAPADKRSRNSCRACPVDGRPACPFAVSVIAACGARV